jgi:hypothetical protein
MNTDCSHVVIAGKFNANPGYGGDEKTRTDEICVEQFRLVTMHPYLQESHFDLCVMSRLMIKRVYLSMSHLNTASKFIFSFAEIE